MNSGVPFENTRVTQGILLGCLPGPILVALHTGDLCTESSQHCNDIPADDTTMCCVGESMDQVTNKALDELALFCKQNSQILHPKRCEGMILKRNHFICPLGSLKINQQLIKWTSSSKLLGVTIVNKLKWTKDIQEFKRRFVSKLTLIKRSRFLLRNSLYDLKVILPSVTYALYQLPVFT